MTDLQARSLCGRSEMGALGTGIGHLSTGKMGLASWDWDLGMKKWGLLVNIGIFSIFLIGIRIVDYFSAGNWDQCPAPSSGASLYHSAMPFETFT